ncbi:LuxR C-terminal-related transcriptional regulator [Arsenophonus sp. PmNCSU2021_1]
MNNAALSYFNVPSGFSMEGRLDNEVPLESSQELWPELVEHDKNVIEKNKMLSAIEIHYYGKSNNKVPHLCNKSPLYDNKNQIIGLVCHGRAIETPTLLHYMNRLNRKKIQFDAPNDTFTKRELEVIFWAQQRLTAKEIAKRLDICPSTIDSHIKSIYRKADVNSNAQLIEYCKHKGLDAYIPSNFIRKGVQLIS